RGRTRLDDRAGLHPLGTGVRRAAEVKIRMLVDRSGPDNGIHFPPKGGELLVPDEIGAGLCAAGYAEPVAVEMPVETRATRHHAPAPEPAPEPPAAPAPALEDPEPAGDEPEAHKAQRRKAPGK